MHGKATETSERVRVDALTAGTKFTPAYGGRWTYERRHADGLCGVCVRDDGHRDIFAGCAEVTLGWHERGWLER